MAAIKSVAKSATVAFAPTAPDVLATGTMSGAIDLAFSSSASLDVFKVDFSNPDPELPLVKAFTTSERFNRLSWGNNGAGTEEYPLGLIAGGLADGSVYLWNPAPLISEDDGIDIQTSLLAKLQKHAGPVRGLEFNVITPNLLASGGDDGELVIWDVINPVSPSHFPPLKGGGPGAQVDISYLSWNRKVQHILASTSNSGTSVVWDLRRQKPIISFTDPSSRRRCSVLQWNPDVATQLIVASDDDRSPSLQVWDLRNSVSPLKEFVGHTKGVLAMAWCPIDSALLLTCAKDNRTLCWDTVSGEIICELPVSSNWNFDVQWSPRIAGVLSTSSFDGKIGIYNIEACSRTSPSEGVFGGALSVGSPAATMRAPKWLKRPVGVNFGFGGKLVSFNTKKAVPGAATVTNSEVRIHTVVTEEGLITRSEEFEAAIADGEKGNMRSYCEQKASLSKSEEEKEIWSFLKVMFEDNARSCLLSQLGFAVRPTENGVDNHDGVTTEISETSNPDDGGPENNTETAGFVSAPVLDLQGEVADDGSDFFNNVETPRGAISPQIMAREVAVEKKTEGNIIAQENDVEEDLDEEDDCDRAIQYALVVGDFKGAVEYCLSADRLADALVLAHVGDPKLWEKTLNEYIRRNHRPYRKVMSAVVAHDIRNLVDSRPLKAWKETLALLCSYARPEDWSVLCDALAARLDSSGNRQAAILCYICAANIEKAVEIWSSDLKYAYGGSNFVSNLQDLMEKTIVLALATGEKRVNASLFKLVSSYVELLASQGMLKTAMEYLKLVRSEESSQDIDILKDRIYMCGQGEVKVEAPYFPSETRELQTESVSSIVTPDLSAYATAPQSSQQYYQDMSPASARVPSYANTYTQVGTAVPSYNVYSQATPQQQNLSQFLSGGSYPSSNASNNQTSNAQVFYPSSVQQPPQPSFNPPPVAQPQVKTFVPANPPPIPNVGQYQQPTNAQVYSGVSGISSMTSYQPSPGAPPVPQQIPNMMLPGPAIPSVTSAPTPRGFMPVTTLQPVAPQQQSILTPPVQPQSPSIMSNSATLPQSVPAAPAPAPTVHNVDTSNVAAEMRGVIATLTRLYNETSEALGGARANPAKKREVDDNSRKLGALFAKLNAADISSNAATKLIQLCQSLDMGDYSTALQIQVGLMTSDWDECSFWLAALKRMIKTRQTLR